MEEGTYNFWNPAAKTDTVIGRILEADPSWHVGYISPSLIGRYRTFSSYDGDLLSFMYGDAPKTFRCVFMFNPYEKTINAVDADEPVSTLPIYLDFDNLVDSVKVEEQSGELVTALAPYGADELDIRGVNPLGTKWIYDLSYFIANGDIQDALAQKWMNWQHSIQAEQAHYTGLVSLKASATVRILSIGAVLVDLRGELDDLINQQSVTIQALALESTAAGKASQQAKLDAIHANITEKRAQISQQETAITEIKQEISGPGEHSYNAQIEAVNRRLAFESYFTVAERSELSQFFREDVMTEETFVSTDVDTTTSGTTSSFSSGSIQISGSRIEKVDLSHEFGRPIYTIAGGTLQISGGAVAHADIIRGTIEVSSGDQFIMSCYTGSMTMNSVSAPSGLVSVTGGYTSLTSDVKPATEDGIITEKGTSLSLAANSASLYVTTNVSDYQQYSVQLELYEYATSVLKDAATPTYEVSVEAANFLFLEEFSAFRNGLELGKGVYLRINEEYCITPLLIELTLDFEHPETSTLIFSNRFKRSDNINTLKDMIESSYSSGRNFDASKYLYNQVSNQSAQVSKFMKDSLDASVNTILAAENQSVVINGGGIQVGGTSKHQMRIIDSMIAMTDDGWQTAKMAIGRFASPEIGEYWGINCEVLGGKLLIGNTLVLENVTDTGVMQFKVDASGAWLNNATFLLQKDGGGKILIDPKYGIVAGNGSLYATNGTTVSPSFIGGDGKIIFDKDSLPKNANFYLDARDGSAYFRGHGVFSGDVYATNGKFTGEVNATSGKFDGDIYANNLYFKDGSNVRTLLSQGTKKIDSSLLDLGNIQLNGTTGDISMTGNINLGGNINIGGNIDFSRAGSIRWGNSTPVKYQFSTSLSGPWHTTMQSTDKYRRDSLDGGTSWGAGYQFLGVNGQPGRDGMDGRDGADGRDGSDASVTRANIVMAMLDNLNDDGLYTTTINGRQCLGIRADAIKVGTLNSIEITGCNITSLNSMTAACDFHVGDRIYLGGKMQNGKAIIFNDNASISNPYDSDSLAIASLGGISLTTGYALDLSGVGSIIWGHNEPVAVFG